MSLSLPNRLRRAIQDDPRQLVLWVGAGLSKNAVREHGKGLPDWDALIGGMAKYLQEGYRDDAALQAKLQKALASKNYPSVANLFARSTTSTAFADFIRSELDPTDLVHSPLHDLILRIGLKGVFTTNFDRVFESNAAPSQTVLKYPDCLKNVEAFRQYGFLAKIHGCVSVPYPTHLVFTTASYRKLLKEGAYHTLLGTCVTAFPVLTVGFSFRDPAFQSVLAALQKVFGSNFPSVFALMLRPDRSTINKLRQKNVDVIPYERRGDLMSFFRELLDLGRRKHPAAAVRLDSPPLPLQRVREAKKIAREFYDAWRRDVALGRSSSPVLGAVGVTLRGWRHITRAGPPAREICHRLSLIPCAREVVEKATDKKDVRHLFGKTLIALEGTYRSPYQADVVVEVIIERSGGRASFLSVHERRHGPRSRARAGST
jgi:SIR2-like domain